MSRVRANMVVGDRECWTLFDTGARNTYVVPEVAEGLVTWEFPRPERVAFGGRSYIIRRGCVLIGTIEGFLVQTHARIVEEIGYDEEGRRLEILFGALAMQEWGIRVLPDEERLDLTHYPKEFVEF